MTAKLLTKHLNIHTQPKYIILSMYLPDYQTEIIHSIEQRSTDTENPFNLLTPRHSFIILKTNSGKLIKCEYHHTGRTEIVYNYLDWVPSITTHSFKPKKEISVHRIVSKFHNIAHSQQFNEQTFNCQQVCRMFIKKTVKCDKLILRNDYLRIIQRYAWFSDHTRLFMQDPLHYKIKSDYEKNNASLEKQKEFKRIDSVPGEAGLNSGKMFFSNFIKKGIDSRLVLFLPSFYEILKDKENCD